MVRLPILVLALAGLLLAQNPPEAGEIAEAYRSTQAEAGLGRTKVQARRIRDIRGWRLNFKQLGQKAGPISTSTRSRVTARQGATCAAYLVTDTIVFGNPRVKPVLHVEPLGGVKPCR